MGRKLPGLEAAGADVNLDLHGVTPFLLFGYKQEGSSLQTRMQSFFSERSDSPIPQGWYRHGCPDWFGRKPLARDALSRGQRRRSPIAAHRANRVKKLDEELSGREAMAAPPDSSLAGVAVSTR
jgi:hypothetical protein